MRLITENEDPKWNPVPLVRGMGDWESNKQDNFGQILFPPVGPLNNITIPAIYILPDALGAIGLGVGKIRLYVTDLSGKDIAEITSQCTLRQIADRWYLKVPPITNFTINRNTSIAFLRFVGLDKASGWTNRMLCSEPYQIRGLGYSSTDAIEKQSTITLRWWSGSDFIVEKGHDEYLLPYEQLDHYFELGFDSQLSKPVYKKTQEGSERDGIFFAEKTVVTKEYHFFFNAPEYLLDALRYVPLADYVEIQQGLTFLAADTIDFDIKWEAEGDIARVDCSFTTNTVLRKSGTIE